MNSALRGFDPLPNHSLSSVIPGSTQLEQDPKVFLVFLGSGSSKVLTGGCKQGSPA